MSTARTRRRFLRAGAGAAGIALGVAGCVRAPGRSSHARTSDGAGSEFPPAVRQRARAVGESARPAVIVLQNRDPLRSGTAWFLEGGHIVTNNHVIDEIGAGFTCRTIDGTEFEAEVRARAPPDGPGPDLAVLGADIVPPATLPPGSSTSLERGQPLVQIGHTGIGYWVIALGEFVRRVEVNGKRWLLTEMPVMLGNSGSPLLTPDGEVVGLTFGTVPRAGGPPARDPTPAPPTVHEQYPRQKVEFGGHLAIETVREYVARWTG